MQAKCGWLEQTSNDNYKKAEKRKIKNKSLDKERKKLQLIKEQKSMLIEEIWMHLNDKETHIEVLE